MESTSWWKGKLSELLLHASAVCFGLNFSLASAPEGKDSEEIKGCGGHGEVSKGEDTSLVYLNDTSIILVENKKRREFMGQILSKSVHYS